MIISRLADILRIVSLALIVCSPTAAARDAAEVPVERFQNGLLEVMRNADTLGFEGRRARLQTLLEETFDLDYVAQAVLGRYWAGLSQADRATLHEAVFRFATSTLAVQFDGYDGERFEIQFARPLKRDRARVRSHFHLEGDAPVMADFVVRPVADGWRIIDFWFDGVSGTQIHRNEFAAVLDREGSKGLISRLQAKIRSIEANKG